MHISSLKRMQWFADKYIPKRDNLKVLDVGSYDVNGNYREIFETKGIEYIGLDMEQGPNVDIVPKNTYKWEELKTDEFDIVVSGQALEHIEFFWKTMEEIVRVTKKDGIICIIAPNGFSEHRYPVDCWRFFTDGMVALARFYELTILHSHTNSAPSVENEEWFSENCADSMLIARKEYEGIAKIINLAGYRCIPINHKVISNEMVTYQEYVRTKHAKEIQSGDEKFDAEKTLVEPRISTIRIILRRIKKAKHAFVERIKVWGER